MMEEEEEENAGQLRHLLSEADGLLARLYEIHDFVFLPDASEKEALMKEQAEKVLEAVAEAEKKEGGDCSSSPSSLDRGKCAYLRGKALDAFRDYSPQAEAQLSRAVKLCPGEVEYWNALGHCFWKKRDVTAAKNSFEEALRKGRNATSLRNLSMLLRQCPNNQEQILGGIHAESIALAKEATLLDLGGSENWYVLGNAHVARFFGETHALGDLESALRAYKKAEACAGGRDNPDLWYNRAQVLHYQQKYTEAAEGYKMAGELDPGLPALEALDDMTRAFKKLADLVAHNGKVKRKRLDNLTKFLAGLVQKRGGGHKDISQLDCGDNTDQALMVSILVPLGTSQKPHQFVIMDASGECAVLSLYQTDTRTTDFLSKASFICSLQEALLVQDPHVLEISLGELSPFKCIRVGHPSQLRHVLVKEGAVQETELGAVLRRSPMESGSVEKENPALRVTHFDM